MFAKIKFILYYSVLALILAGAVGYKYDLYDFAKEAKAEPKAADIMSACSPETIAVDGISKETCYNKQFTELGEDWGAQKAFDLLFELQKIDPESRGCHLIAHGIGWGAFKREPENWQKLVQTLYAGCSYGAIHGVIESHVATLPDKRLTREVMPAICGDQPRADCNHIVGHLTLVATGADIDEALSMCGIFAYDQRQKIFCYTGVFMEFQTALNLIEHGLAPKSWLDWPRRVPELEQVCRSYEGDMAVSCWEEIIHAAAVKLNNDPKTLWEFCSTAQIPEAAQRCRRHSVGVLIASRDYDLDKIKFMCALPQKDDPNFQKECYIYIIGSTVASIPQTAGPKVVDFCLSLEPGFQQSCFGEVGTMFRDNGAISSSALASLCAAVPEVYRAYCLNGHNGGSIYKDSQDRTD